MSEVIALAGWPPEVLAYAYAMYSRSPLSIRESVKKITGEKSDRFFESYYFSYGHRSIADNAHIPLAFENISQIAAFEIESEQLWDGQERSTRFQNFARSDGYFIPSSIRDSPLQIFYENTADMLLRQYAKYSKLCFDQLAAENPKPADMKDENYERTLRARAFDVARYWLFGGILTSVGQITSARTLETQISRLMSSEYEEVRRLGVKAKSACLETPFCPDGRNEPPVAPTLMKYAAPNDFIIKSREYLRGEAELFGLFAGTPPSGYRYVKLITGLKLIDEIVATFFYEVLNRPYKEIAAFVSSMLTEERKAEIIENIMEFRSKHDPWPGAFKAGHLLQFDIVMDRGGERDLHRHRNCIQIHQPLTAKLGWDVPELVKRMGLADDYCQQMEWVKNRVDILRDKTGVDANYLIPFAFRSGTLYKMDLAQAFYMTKLRSSPQGHFSYREIACQMHDLMLERWPVLVKHAGVTPFDQTDIFKR